MKNSTDKERNLTENVQLNNSIYISCRLRSTLLLDTYLLTNLFAHGHSLNMLPTLKIFERSYCTRLEKLPSIEDRGQTDHVTVLAAARCRTHRRARAQLMTSQ